MTFTAVPGLVPFGDIFRQVTLARPYMGPTMPHYDDPSLAKYCTPMTGEVTYIDDEHPFAIHAMAHDQWQRGCRDFIVKIMEAERVPLTVTTDKPDLPPLSLSAEVLLYIPPHLLECSIFDTLYGQLMELSRYDKGRIFVSPELSNAVRKALSEMSRKGGRPRHPAFSWYEAQGFDRRGLSFKALQRAMPADERGNPPSETTIRDWEREFGAPTETRKKSTDPPKETLG